MELSCYRDRELAREPRYLPASTYNLAHTLLARSPGDCVFVPIRSMQYVAIIAVEEIDFHRWRAQMLGGYSLASIFILRPAVRWKIR
jgi:hypothetical protein